MAEKEPGKLVLNIFDELINRVKSTRPVNTNGESLTTGFVYSQLVLGRMVDPQDYADPWTPNRGASIEAAVSEGDLPANAASATNKIQSAVEAAYRTSQLVDSMVMVTNDDTYLSYPAERKVSFAYESIINGMQPSAAPPVPDEIKEQINDAYKVLYELEEDDNGDLIKDEEGYYISTGYKTRMYEEYLDYADDYAEAKYDYSQAKQMALADPVRAQHWPMDSVYHQRKVDQAWDDLKTAGAERIERALDVIKSVGVSMQNRMVAKSRQVYDAWNLGLAGVPVTTPYAYIEPSGWAETGRAPRGWQTLKVTAKEYNSHSASSTASNFERHWENHASSKQGGGKVSFGFGFFNRVKAGASGGSSSTSSSYEISSESESGFKFNNDAKNLSIEIEYGICTVHRPWLMGDLFYMRNWYLVNNPENAISDGSVESQVGDEAPLLPMIPRQFLAIRNVKIKATEWNSDGETLSKLHSSVQGDRASKRKFVSGGAGFSIGLLTLGGGGSSSSSNSETNQSGESGSSDRRDFGWRFDGEELEIKGTQIIAWLSEVVPACAPMADPGLSEEEES